MIEENTRRKSDGQPSLTKLPKPCDYFDLIGGTSTGGCAPSYMDHYHDTHKRLHSYRIVALMLGRLRMDVDTAIDSYNNLAQQVFSDPKRWPADGKFKATKLEEAIKSVVHDVTGDPEEPLLEVDSPSVCRT